MRRFRTQGRAAPRGLDRRNSETDSRRGGSFVLCAWRRRQQAGALLERKELVMVLARIDKLLLNFLFQKDKLLLGGRGREVVAPRGGDRAGWKRSLLAERKNPWPALLQFAGRGLVTHTLTHMATRRRVGPGGSANGGYGGVRDLPAR